MRAWDSKGSGIAVRMWSIHPKYLDAPGLVALWREGLLAQAVLNGKTRGYTNHPQIFRFKKLSSPLGFLSEYLRIVHREAVSRGYHFDARKIGRSRASGLIDVTRGQIEFEWRHLMEKLRTRNPRWKAALESVKCPQQHPLFRVRRGGKAEWERGKPPSQALKPTLCARSGGGVQVRPAGTSDMAPRKRARRPGARRCASLVMGRSTDPFAKRPGIAGMQPRSSTREPW